MSQTTSQINKINKKLNSISGLDGYFVQERLNKISKLVNRYVEEINKHEEENEFNCTIFLINESEEIENGK